MNDPANRHLSRVPHLGWVAAYSAAVFAADVLAPTTFGPGPAYLVPLVVALGLRRRDLVGVTALTGIALTTLGFLLARPTDALGPALTNRALTVAVLVVTTWLGLRAAREHERSETLARQHREVEQLFQSISAVLIHIDGRGRIRRWNRAAERAFGLPACAVLRRGVRDCGVAWDERDLEQFVAALEAAMDVRGMELRFTDAGGGRRCVGASLRRLDGEGGLTGTLILARDITDEQAQRQLQKRLITAVEQVDETIVITDLQGKILYANPAFERVTGYGRAEAIGLDPSVLKSGKHAPEFYAELWATIESGEVWTGHFTNRRKDGTLYEEDATISPVRDENDEITNFVAVKRDVTERRALELQLRTAQRLESIGQLAAGIAHEINTPAQFISDNAQFLRTSFQRLTPLLERCRRLTSEPWASAAAELAELRELAARAKLDLALAEAPLALEESLQGLARVSEIVSAMKSFSHPGTRTKEAVDLNEIVRTAVTLSTNEWKYAAEVVTELDPDLPQLQGLPGPLGQVVLNLVVNAAHAIQELRADERGRITVRTCAEERGAWVRLEVEDTGCGIPAEGLERVFDPFYTTKEVGKGTGQGLAISHSVVADKHGGRICVRSEVGRGTTFTVHLPVSASAEEPEHEPMAA